MKIFSVVVLFFICAVSAPLSSSSQIKTKSIDYIMLDGRSGCCSHHGGVCGCSNGRAQCCDGSLSPSCGC